MEQLQANHTLAHFLARNGACTPETAEEFKRVSMSKWKPLGHYLRESCGLTMKDIARVLGEQAMRPTHLFGDIAVELGICKVEDVTAARERQLRECPHVVDLALSDPRVDREKCLEAIRDYIRFSERILDLLGQQFSEMVPQLTTGSLI